jgi:hypothetical protein
MFAAMRGRIKEGDDVSRSLSQDRRKTANKKAKAGQRDRGRPQARQLQGTERIECPKVTQPSISSEAFSCRKV